MRNLFETTIFVAAEKEIRIHLIQRRLSEIILRNSCTNPTYRINIHAQKKRAALSINDKKKIQSIGFSHYKRVDRPVC